MRASEAQVFSNISATTAAFHLNGGKYAFAAHATWSSGSAKLQVLLPDGSSYVSVSSGTDLTADGFAVVDLPPGTYQIAIATATAVYASVTRIPGE